MKYDIQTKYHKDKSNISLEAPNPFRNFKNNNQKSIQKLLIHSKIRNLLRNSESIKKSEISSELLIDLENRNTNKKSV